MNGLLVFGIAAVLAVLIEICIICTRPKSDAKKGKVFIGMVISCLVFPIITGGIANYIYNFYFNENSSALWYENITAVDEKIMVENGCENLNEYYARIIETDEQLPTGLLSKYFQRIDTTKNIRGESGKYRYIETICKENHSAPSTVVYITEEDKARYTTKKTGKYVDSEEIVDVLRLNNRDTGYIDKCMFYSREGSAAVYYLYQDCIAEEHNMLAETSPLVEDIFCAEQRVVIGSHSEQMQRFEMTLICKKKLPVEQLEKGNKRIYLGKGYYEFSNGLKEVYRYLQTIDYGNKRELKQFTVLNFRTSPRYLKNHQGSSYYKAEKIVFSDRKLFDTQNTMYVFCGTEYLKLDDCQICHPYFVYTVYRNIIDR